MLVEADPEIRRLRTVLRDLVALSGGANATRGSGLIGLSDRVDALGGTIELTSPVGGGTTLLVRLPIESEQP